VAKESDSDANSDVAPSGSKKRKSGRVRKHVVESDDNDSNFEALSDEDQEEEEEEVNSDDSEIIPKKKTRRRKASTSSEQSGSESEEKPKKRRRIKHNSESGSGSGKIKSSNFFNVMIKSTKLYFQMTRTRRKDDTRFEKSSKINI